MAIWNGSVINSNDTAFVFNKLANRKAVPMVRRKNGFLYAILGKEEVGSTPGVTGFQRLKSITGNKVEVRLLGAVASPTTVADANQTDAVDYANAATNGMLSNGAWGAAEFPITHYQWPFLITDSELQRYKGDELKTVAFMDEYFDRVMLSYEKVWGTQLSMANIADTTNMADSSRTVLGSWVYAIAGSQNLSGASTDWANGGTYGTINRADSGNADFRGNVYTNQGDLTLGKILTAKNACIINGGNPTVGIAGTTLYTKIEGLVSSYTQVAYADDWNKFAGAHTMYSGIRFVLDNYCASTVVGLLDPTTWQFYSNMTDFTTTGIIPDPSRRATYVLQTSPWVQNVCLSPNKNAVIGGLTS
jgi:hypothetical protein